MSGNPTPKFSIIVPHYDGVISDEQFIRGMNCLKNQTFTDFEVLLYHDGPISRPIPKVDLPNLKIVITEKRYNDWGHSLRDMGIKAAEGEYIIHFNPDNILYPFALQHIYEKSIQKFDADVPDTILIFPIWMIGTVKIGSYMFRVDEDIEKNRVALPGYPPTKFNIDCMQLVMRRSAWLDSGGWADKAEQSDGNMYPNFVRKHGARYCNFILGEHR